MIQNKDILEKRKQQDMGNMRIGKLKKDIEDTFESNTAWIGLKEKLRK